MSTKPVSLDPDSVVLKANRDWIALPGEQGDAEVGAALRVVDQWQAELLEIEGPHANAAQAGRALVFGWVSPGYISPSDSLRSWSTRSSSRARRVSVAQRLTVTDGFEASISAA